MNEKVEDRRSKDPFGGIAVVGGILAGIVGITDPQELGAYLIAGAILFSGGIISLSLQSRD